MSNRRNGIRINNSPPAVKRPLHHSAGRLEI
jgi:hypothetical protein